MTLRFGINFVGAGEKLYDVANLYATQESAGIDLRADLTQNVIYYNRHNQDQVIEPGGLVKISGGERLLIQTGIKIYLAPGFEAQVRSRSGLSLKSGIIMGNSPGTIDSDYAGQIGMIVANISDATYAVKHGERLGQLVVNEIVRLHPFVMTDEKHAEFHSYKMSDRASGGFGSTGTN